MYLRRILFSVLVLVFPLIAKGQNLVQNPSFEDYVSCPNIYDEFYKVAAWYNPTLGTPDYLNACANVIVSIPENTFGYENARTGQAYSHLFLYDIFSEYREYIAVELTKPLVNGQCYTFEMYCSSADKDRYRTDAVQVLFSPYGLHQATPEILPFTPQIENPKGAFIDTMNWTKVSGSFVASGGEKFIFIGNFYDNSHTDTVWQRINTYYGYASIFVDDVFVQECCQSIDATTVSVATQPNQANGLVTINATGGVPPYSYSLDYSTFQSSNVFSGLGKGNYTAYVVDSVGCLATEDFVINQLTSVDNDDQSIGFECYPNPVGDLLSLRSKVPLFGVQIYNSNGVLVINKNLNGVMESVIKTNDLSEGVYILTLTTESDKLLSTRLIKRYAK